LGKVSKGVKCSVADCSEKAAVSLSASNVSKYMSVAETRGTAYLCRSHYKQYKKLSKKDRELERARYLSI